MLTATSPSDGSDAVLTRREGLESILNVAEVDEERRSTVSKLQLCMTSYSTLLNALCTTRHPHPSFSVVGPRPYGAMAMDKRSIAQDPALTSDNNTYTPHGPRRRQMIEYESVRNWPAHCAAIQLATTGSYQSAPSTSVFALLNQTARTWGNVAKTGRTVITRKQSQGDSVV